MFVPRQRLTASAFIAMVALLLACSVDGRAADLSEPQTFASDAALTDWEFSNGPEWPGARGALEWRSTGGRDNDGVLVLSYDFEGGGHYTAALVKLPADPPVVAVRLWVKKPAANLMIFRAVDAEGETFQKELRFDYEGWQQLEIGLEGWIHRWGGDGRFAPPARRFDILLENQGGSRKGEVLIDDVQWVYRRADAEHTRRATYVESTFAATDGWAAEGGRLAGGDWHYDFSGDRAAVRLRWGRSLLGRPQALRLIVESDGGGHELRAVLGSHFQNFERSLGVLCAAGPQTFEVPLGDLKTWTHSGGQDDGVVRYPLRLEALVLNKQGPTTAGRVTLRALEVTTEYEPWRAVVLIPRVHAAGPKLRFTAEVRSLHPTPLAGLLHVALRGLDGTFEERAEPFEVPALGRATAEVVSEFGGRAMVEGEFEFTARADGVTSGRRSVTIARVPPASERPAPDPDSAIGAGLYLYRFRGHPEARAEMDRLCRLAAAAGVKWTREEFHWNWLEPRPGEFDFAFFDQLVAAAEAHGIRVYGLMCYYTEWNRPPVTDEFITHYCNYLKAVVSRYKDRIRHWEIWNEPNIFFWPGPKERYPVLLKRAYETIKAVDPQAEVLGCSTAGIDTGFIQMVLDAGAPFDALTVHPYRAELDPPGFMRELRAVRELVGGRDVWVTEMGWPSPLGGHSERVQAGYVARTYIAALASGAARTVAWYNFREDGVDPFYEEHHFGLVRHDLTPKMGYRALAAVGRLLGPTRAGPQVQLGEGLLAYAFVPRPGAPDARHVLALWSPDGTRAVRLGVAPQTAELYNALGEPLGPAGPGLRLLRLEQNLPVYVAADGPIEVATMPPPVALRAVPTSVHPGTPVQISWRAEADVTIESAVAPGGWDVASERNAIRVTPPVWAEPGRHEIRVLIEFDGEPLELPVHINVVPALLRG